MRLSLLAAISKGPRSTLPRFLWDSGGRLALALVISGERGVRDGAGDPVGGARRGSATRGRDPGEGTDPIGAEIPPRSAEDSTWNSDFRVSFASTWSECKSIKRCKNVIMSRRTLQDLRAEETSTRHRMRGSAAWG